MKALLLFLPVLTGCVITNYQVLETATPGGKEQSGYMAFGDSSIELRYALWSKGGELSFAVINRADNPIYIDWSKSNFIINGYSLNYFQNTQRTVMKGVGVTTLFGKNEGINYSTYSATTIAEEKVTHLPPKAAIVVTKFRVADHVELPFKSKFKKIKQRKNDVIIESYDQNNSPVVFRNYLSYSFNPDMSSLIQTDNLFYVDRIRFMNSMKFEPAESEPSSFYLTDTRVVREGTITLVIVGVIAVPVTVGVLMKHVF